MPFALATEILNLVSLYFIFRDNCFWKWFRYRGSHFEEKLKKINPLFKDSAVEDLNKKSRYHASNYNAKINTMFKTKQSRSVKSFLQDLYQSKEEALQQLYFVLSLPFITKKHFLQMVVAWNFRKKQAGENIDKFCHDAYWHALDCGEIGAY